MLKIYLAGSMENVSVEESKSWRVQASAWLTFYGFKVLDPTRRVHSFKQSEFKKIFDLDIRDIQSADIVLVNLNNPKLAKHGTAMEVFYANYILKKPVVAFKEDPSVKHPFFEQLVTEWFSDVKSAVEAIASDYQL